MIDYQKDKAELLERLKRTNNRFDTIIDAWGQGPKHLSLFDNLDVARYSHKVSCGCVTIVKNLGSNDHVPSCLKSLTQEILDDPLIPPNPGGLIAAVDLEAVLDRFVYYQEQCDKILGRTL
jgi:hypothetical protein